MTVRAVLFDLGDTLWHFPEMPPINLIRAETVRRISDLLRTWGIDPEGELFFLGRTLFPDVIPTLGWLRERDYRIGSVTNRALGGEPFRQELCHYGLLDYFEVLSISCDVGYMKPHAAIFQHALEALAVAPAEAVMVGDSLRADVAGAQALGMTAVWKRDHSSDDEERPLTLPDGQGPVVVIPDYTIETLGDLPGLAIFA